MTFICLRMLLSSFLLDNVTAKANIGLRRQYAPHKMNKKPGNHRHLRSDVVTSSTTVALLALSSCTPDECASLSTPYCDAKKGVCVVCLIDDHCHSKFDETYECVYGNENNTCKKMQHMEPISINAPSTTGSSVSTSTEFTSTSSTLFYSSSSSSTMTSSTSYLSTSTEPIDIGSTSSTSFTTIDTTSTSAEELSSTSSSEAIFRPAMTTPPNVPATNGIDAIVTSATTSSSSDAFEMNWPDGDDLYSYDTCNFNCCSNDDCSDMTDEKDRVVGGCCADGQCQIKPTTDVFCPAVIGPPADIKCGYSAWNAFVSDGNCKTDEMTTSSSSPFSSSSILYSSSSSTTDPNSSSSSTVSIPRTFPATSSIAATAAVTTSTLPGLSSSTTSSGETVPFVSSTMSSSSTPTQTTQHHPQDSRRCEQDSDCPTSEPYCEDLSNGMCWFPPCGYCRQGKPRTTLIPLAPITTSASTTSTTSTATTTPEETFSASGITFRPAIATSPNMPSTIDETGDIKISSINNAMGSSSSVVVPNTDTSDACSQKTIAAIVVVGLSFLHCLL